MTIVQALNLMISFSTLIVAVIALSFTFNKKSKPPLPSTQSDGLLFSVLFAFEANYDVAKRLLVF